MHALLLFLLLILSLFLSRCFDLHAFVAEDGGWMILVNMIWFYCLLFTIVHV